MRDVFGRISVALAVMANVYAYTENVWTQDSPPSPACTYEKRASVWSGVYFVVIA